jgi:hypothetical protein
MATCADTPANALATPSFLLHAAPCRAWPAALLWQPDDPNALLLLDLSTAEWQQLAAAAHTHHLAPLLHWQLRRLLPAGAPAPVADLLRQAYTNSALTAGA